MARTRKGVFGTALVILGGLLLAVMFFIGSKSRSVIEPPADKAEMGKSDSVGKVEKPAATQPAPVDGDPTPEPEIPGRPPLKETTLLKQVTRKSESGERIVVLEVGETVEVVTVQGSRIYVRTPEGETIGIPVTATDWTTHEDENRDR